jgi:hypothetical protein
MSTIDQQILEILLQSLVHGMPLQLKLGSLSVIVLLGSMTLTQAQCQTRGSDVLQKLTSSLNRQWIPDVATGKVELSTYV